MNLDKSELKIIPINRLFMAGAVVRIDNAHSDESGGAIAIDRRVKEVQQNFKSHTKTANANSFQSLQRKVCLTFSPDAPSAS